MPSRTPSARSDTPRARAGHGPRRRPAAPRPRGAARREALLEAVLAIVAEVGPDAVTHRKVAETAGLPLASTTYWFQSKDHLLTAALELAAERDVARLRDHALTTARTDCDPLAAAVATMISPEAATGAGSEAPSTRASPIATFALLLEAARRPGLREVAQRWTDAYLDTLEPMLREAGSSDPRQDAELLVAAADGLLLEQLTADGHGDLRPRLLRLARALVAS